MNKQEEERNRVQKYLQRFNKAKMAVQNKHNIWAKLDTFDRGDQWKDASLPTWIPKPVTNMLRYVRTLKRANLASAIPSAKMSSRFMEYQEDVEKLQRAYDHVWETENLPRKIRRSIDRSLLQGTSIAYVFNDNDYIGGTYLGENDPGNTLYQGRICVRRIPSANFFPDPDATRIDDPNMKFCEFTENLPLSTVKNNPKFKEYAGKKLEQLSYSQFAQDDDESGEIYRRDTNIAENGQRVENDETVTLHTHFERYINEDGRWQLDITWYLTNTDFELYRIEDYQPSVYPFAVLYDEEEEGDFWGTSTLMDILENQKIINKTSQTASIIGTMHQNPQKVVHRESGINAQEMARMGTLPGKVWVSNIDPRMAVSHIETKDIPRGLMELEDRMKNDIREIAGINEAYTGESVGSLTTSTGVNSLIERATLRDKDKMLQIDEFVEQISNLIILHIIYTWKDRRQISVTGPDGNPQYYIFEPLDEDTIRNIDWVIKSDVYATAPTTLAQRREQADRLMQLQGQFNFNPPIITAEEWIQFQDFDMKEQILRRIQKDRERLEREKSLRIAENLVQVAEIIRQNIAQGMPVEQAQQAAVQAVEEMLAQQEQEEMLSGRPRDAAREAQAPQGVAGQQAMMAMARGS